MKLSIELINAQLKAANVKVKVLQRGNSLYLQATLPPKPGEVLYRQRQIALKLSASQDGLAAAKAKAHKLAADLAFERFDWTEWDKKIRRSGSVTIEDTVERFREHYQSQHRLSDSSWDAFWGRIYRRLPQDKPLTEAVVLSAILQIEADSWTRRQACDKFQRLCDFAEVQINLKPYRGTGRKNERQIELPIDEQIAEWYHKIPHEPWRRVYGKIAAFGIRPHEAFFSERIDAHTLQVKDGKTKGRIVRAIPAEWAEWDLDGELPSITCKQFRDYGSRIAINFNRYKIPWPAYSLRHAWCVRASVVYRLPDSVAAAMAGHSVELHTSTYQRWMRSDQSQRVYNELVLGRSE